MLFYPFTLLRWLSQAAWKNQVQLHQPVKVVLDEQGIREENVNYKFEASWESISKLLQSEERMCIYFTPVMFIVIPRRDLCAEQWEKLRKAREQQNKNREEYYKNCRIPAKRKSGEKEIIVRLS